jgi:hypothetical protein
VRETREECQELMRMFFEGSLSRAARKRVQRRLVEDREFFEAAMPVMVGDWDREVVRPAPKSERPKLEMVR